MAVGGGSRRATPEAPGIFLLTRTCASPATTPPLLTGFFDAGCLEPEGSREHIVMNTTKSLLALLLLLAAVPGTSAVPLDASQPGTSTSDANSYDCP